MPVQIEIDKEKLERFCREHNIQRLLLFGSVLTDKFGPDSDVDVLVDFEPGTRIGFIGFVRLEMDLCELIGRDVDLHTPNGLRPAVRETVLPEAEVLYAA